MPLVPETFKTALKNRIESRLKSEFKKTNVKKDLRRLLDGGPLNGNLSESKSIHDSLEKITSISKTVSLVDGGGNYTPIIRRITSNEWANSISESISEWLSESIAPIIAEELATIISDETTKYIKTATIITQPGQLVNTAGSPVAQTGSTISPSTPATIT